MAKKKSLKKKKTTRRKTNPASPELLRLREEALMLLRVTNALMVRFGYNAEDAILAQVVLPETVAPVNWARDDRGVYTLRLDLEQYESEEQEDEEEGENEAIVETPVLGDDDEELEALARSLRGDG